jgi:hypothetical protein
MSTHVTSNLPEAGVGDMVRFQCVYPDCVPQEKLKGIVTGCTLSGQVGGKKWYDVEVTTNGSKDTYMVYPEEFSKLRRDGITYIKKSNAMIDWSLVEAVVAGQ